METKEMTKEEVLVYLNNTKIICTSEEETTKVQEKLFELGVEWMLQGRIISKDKYLLFINDRQKLQHCSDIEFWINDVNKRIEPNEILSIQIKEEPKPKFDPKTLKPFDKVLVRDSEEEDWKCNIFSHYREMRYQYYCVCVYEYWTQCIPYNEETKHLVGTKEEAPEFYRIK